ncbi:MAG: ATP-binding protein [Verrucomicrobiota bacterium]|nr:ATP-binding protein [Verrucomicrobiota bacterium]HOA62569.1 ATP-binding protein [Verrucomicrobiota bacterium]HOF47656.1 ATP-binding protein [Verrucomicrobiota bacterium]HOU87199.1 ATP-binding protein [Verrucomicrobiota bacterium]HPK97267.1 ATP-binding protein [Verrucomicrobiota bacterium]
MLAVIVWIERTAWRQIDRLRPTLDESGPALGSLIGELKADVLEHQLRRMQGEEQSAPLPATRIQASMARLQTRLKRPTGSTFSATQQTLMLRLCQALTNYTETMKSPVSSGALGDSLAEVLALCDELTQKTDLEMQGRSSAQSAALASLQRVWFLSLMLMAAAGAAVVAVFYRRLIAPLRAQLSESRTHLERHEKLASLGVLAAGIAHEIRNPLTAIKVRLFSLKRSVSDAASARDDVQVINDEINRLERIVGDFLQFARPPELERQMICVESLLADVGDFLAPQLAKKSVRLVQEPVPRACVLADPSKMKQVLINLVQNAGQSIEGEGTVTLRVVLSKRPLLGSASDVAIIEVADTGKGMPPEVVRRLFDPFFTTKEDGTGLGLPIAARIVELHGGVVEYDTQLQRGTTFRIVLPRAMNHEKPSPHSTC